MCVHVHTIVTTPLILVFAAISIFGGGTEPHLELLYMYICTRVCVRVCICMLDIYIWVHMYTNVYTICIDIFTCMYM